MLHWAKIITRWLLALSLCTSFHSIALANPIADGASAKPHTLVLYSYGYGARGVEVFSDGFVAANNATGEGVNETFFEYLDLERNQGKDYRKRFIDSLLKKYQNRNIAAVVTVQQPALDFLLKEGTALAAGVPAITVQAPIPPLAELRDRRIISMLARFDIEGTLRHAVDLFPQTRRVVFVSGSSKADRMAADAAAAAAARWKSRLDFEYTVDLSLADILKRTASLPEHSVIIFTQYNSDILGLVAPAYEVEAKVIRLANAPVFGLYDFNLKNGGVGGSVISVTDLGAATAKLAAEVESGKFNATEVVTKKEQTAVPMFDLAQIERWGGDLSRLPNHAIVFNKRLGLWEGYRGTVITSAMVFLLLVFLIAALLLQRRRRKVAEEELKAQETLYRALTQASPVGVFRTTANGNCVYVNARWSELTGLSAQEAAGDGWGKALHPDDRARVTEIWYQASLTGALFQAEYRFLRPDGTIRWVYGQSQAELSKTLEIEGYVGTVTDITERKAAQAMLDIERTHLHTLIDTIPDLVWLKDAHGVYLACNQRFEDFFGAKASEIIGKTDYDFVDKALADSFRKNDRLAMERDSPSVNEERVTFAVDGHQELLETTKIAMSDANGDLIGVLGIGHDITERNAAQTKLELAASVFTHAREGIMITDAAGTIVDVNDTFTSITGFSKEDAVGKTPRILKSGRQSPEYYAALWKALEEKGYWYGETWNRRKNGEIYPEMQTISAVRDSNGITQHYVSLFSDITSIKAHAQELEHIAHFDLLTQLPNRVLLTDRLQQALLQCQRRNNSMAVVFIDLDGFKAVNDMHGHSAGDELLIVLAQRIKAAMREGDTLARVGGDEFVALLVDLDQVSDCELVLTRMLQSASDPVTVGDSMVRVSASMGVTLYPQDGAEGDILLRHADQAMYTAKQAGRNRYHLFDIAQDEVIQIHREGRKQIRAALKNQEFVLFYQPKVNLQTGAVVGAEALIRWQHPQRGLLSPAMFLQIVEDDPLGVTLGEWVTETALSQMATWRRNGLDIPVSINIGAKQLMEPHFVEQLSALLQAHPDVPPSCLELEVLETSALNDLTHVSEVMRASRELGVCFALDDFGTGYSSLTYLRRLPTATLKIDQSFVRDMLTDPADLSIVQGVIGLAQAFRCSVIAEGVETHAHGKLLVEMGCELAQGYGIARPMPAADLPGWVASWQLKPVWTA